MTGGAKRTALWFGSGGIALALLIGGCSDSTEGRPVGAGPTGTEPDFPTSRPDRTTTTPTQSPITPAPAPPPVTVPPGGENLAPQNGYVFIETKSGQTRCQISDRAVGCEAEFENSPEVDGFPANGVNVTAAGEVTWLTGNLGDIPTVQLDYRTYTALGWTIVATEDGTRFTNDGTGHGMFVRVEGVETY